MKKLISAFTAAAIVLSGISITPVFAAENYIKNGDFSQDGNEWHGEGSGTYNQTIENIAEISSTDSEYEYKLSQAVELPDGTYDLTVKAAVDNIEGIYYVYAKSDGHTMASTSIPQGDKLYDLIVPGIIVENGRCDVGIYAKGKSTVKVTGFSLVKSSESTRVPLLKGGEISKLTYVENMGGKFYRSDGTEGDALQIMAENGFNLARIRVLNDPGKGHGDGTYYLPDGYQNLDDCLKLARRAKDKGMQIEFTFAYSDYWVDGDKQMIPHEWQEYIDNNKLTGTDKYKYLEDQVYNYTKDVMQKLKKQNTTPEYVSIGNEMQAGLFFGNAKANGYKHENLYYTDWDWLVSFVNAGARAVKEVSPSTKVIVHSDKGGEAIKWSDTPFYYLLGKAENVDIMAVSYYPYYKSSINIDNVVTEFNTCISKFNKDVMIMETGYNFAEKRSDGYEGQLQDNGFYQDIYGETISGQKAYLTELYAKMKTVAGGRCIGVSYWDPVMITDKVSWAISEKGDWPQGNVITNSTIFDFDGKAVAGQLAMKYNTNATDKVLISGKAKKDAEFDLVVNGNTMSVRADKFGDYIAAVDYPTDGKLRISANGTGYSVDAPYDGVLLNGIDLISKYKNELKAENGLARADFSAYIESDEQMLGLVVKYDDNGVKTGAKPMLFVPVITKSESAEIEYSEKDKRIRSFLWRATDMKPVIEAKSIFLK